MKKYLLFILSFCICELVFSQSQDQNYIKTTEYLSNTDLSKKKVNIKYFDGLGRPMQTISVGQTPDKKDVVLPIEYDEFGRQTKDYLPFPSTQSNGNFLSSGTQGSQQYYQTNYGTSLSYSEKEFEASPLNRVLKQAASGEEWKLGSGHEIKFEYKTNTNNEVKIFKAITQWNDSKKIYEISLKDYGYYETGELYKIITKDENHTSGKDHTIEEYKNKQGQVILKRTYNAGVPHDTYYVYDIYGNLIYVLPPIVNHDSPINSTVLDNLCYQYKYDARNRLAEKKLPGKDWEYMVYDNQDRLVATQDRLLRDKNQWLFTKYDKFARVTYTGIASGPPERTTLQNTINTSFHHNNSIKTEEVGFTKNGLDIQYAEDQGWPTNAIEIFTVEYYDNYDIPYPTSTPTSVEGQLVITDIPQENTHYVTTKGLSTASFTRILETNKWQKTYIFYDAKSRAIRTVEHNHLGGGYTYIDTKYDFRGKVLKTITTHKRDQHSTDIKITDNYTYDHAERLVKHTQKIDDNQEELIAHHQYDDLGQLAHKKVGGQDTSGNRALQQIDYTYNIRGWLKGINDNGNEGLYPSDNTPKDLFRFKIEYNKDIYYSPEGVEPLYNGNIAQTEWMTITDNKSRTYTYAYDALNRLKKAYYGKSGIYKGNYDEHLQYDKNGNITNLQRWGTADYKVKNYNPDMDELTYKYYDGTNRLKSVADATGSTKGFKDGVTQNIEYQYDANGNMTVDANKGITQIQYNHLNLPTSIKFQNNNKITYLYNAQGIKLEKQVITSQKTDTTEYLGSFQYKNQALVFIHQPEGYIDVKKQSNHIIYNYVYHYKDHLGNIRLSYTDANKDGVIANYRHPKSGQMVKEILEENNYYPFGLKHQDYNTGIRKYKSIRSIPRPMIIVKEEVDYKFMYQGQERQDELDLNWDSFKWRNYDYALGRFMSVDPLVETTMQPYSAFNNNPIYFMDPDGRMSVPPGDFYDQNGNYIGTDGIDDGKRYVVTNNREVRAIRRANRRNQTTQTSNVQSEVEIPSNTALSEALNVLDRTTGNGGLSEEASLVMNDGTVLQGKRGEAVEFGSDTHASAELPNLPEGTTATDVEVSIHSHPTAAAVVGEQVFSSSALDPSNTDSGTFSQFGTNIIVGRLGLSTGTRETNSRGESEIRVIQPRNGVVIYNNGGTTPSLQLSPRAIRRIVDNEN